MKRFLIGLFASALLSTVAAAQQAEQVAIHMGPYYAICGQENIAAGNQADYLENWAGILGIVLPSPTYITRVELFNQGTLIPAANNGDVAYSIDPGKTYIKSSGFPATQNGHPGYLNKNLGDWEIRPSGTQKVIKDFNPPVSYHPGIDAFLIAPECNGPGSFQFYLIVWFQANGDLATTPVPPPPPGATTVFQTSLSPVSGNPPSDYRTLVPSISVGGSQIRVHLPAVSTAYSVQHVGVGLQSGSGPNTVSTPIELTFGGASGAALASGVDAWSDWISFPTQAGQSLIVTISDFSPGNTNVVTYKSSGGSGGWSSSTDGWNVPTMPGTLTARPGTDHFIDQVQVQ